MPVTFVCPACAARMSVEERVATLRCPACRVLMQPQDAEETTDATGVVSCSPVPAVPVAPAAHPHKGLRIARPVRAFGDSAGSAPAASGGARPGSAEETQSVPAPLAPGGSLALEMEKLVQNARRQAEKEAAQVLEAARLKAQQEGEAYRRALQEDFEAQAAVLRQGCLDRAAEEAAAILAQARQQVEAEATAQAEEMRRVALVDAERLATEARAQAQAEADGILAQARADAEAVRLQSEARVEESTRTLVEEAKEAAAGVRERAQQEAEALRRKAADESEAIRRQAVQEAEGLRRQAATARTEAEPLQDEARGRPAEASRAAVPAASPLLTGSPDASPAAAAAPGSGAAVLPPAGELDELRRQVRESQAEAERVRQALDSRLKAEAEAKEGAFRDASEAHRLQFHVSMLLRLVGPVLLLYGLYALSRARVQGPAAVGLAAFFLVLSLGLSVWGMLLGRRLKRHVDGLFEFLFREKLRAARAPDGSANGDSTTAVRSSGSSAGKSAAGLSAVGSRRFGKTPTRNRLNRAASASGVAKGSNETRGGSAAGSAAPQPAGEPATAATGGAAGGEAGGDPNPAETIVSAAASTAGSKDSDSRPAPASSRS